MPRAGYKTVCVKDEVYRFIREKAKQNGQSIHEYIDFLLKKEENERRKA